MIIAMANITDKIKSFYNKMNQQGLSFPVLKDPTTQQPSVSLTMMIISFVFCLAGLMTKLNSTDLDVDMSQALTLFGVTSALYFSRKATTAISGTSVTSTISSPEDKS